MDIVYAVVAVAIVAELVRLSVSWGRRRGSRTKATSVAGAVLQVYNDMYMPTAANAAIVLEEEKEQRTAIPAGEDKDFANKSITIVIPEKAPKK